VSKKRDAPAYQEYAANVMARHDYRAMSLAERGLLYTLRNECWVNRQVPADTRILARILGYEQAEVEAALPAVMPFFAKADGHIVCPELDDYREALVQRRELQSQGGKQGAARTNSKHLKPPASSDAAKPPGYPPGKSRGARESLVQTSAVQTNPTQVLNDAPVKDDWVSDYERASNGF
jgi:uncharacterized protein YdaU (DUF1376 family)